jgi:hypothetical protein
MDIYHGWCDLKPGVRDMTFVEAFTRYMEHLKREGWVEGFRITRRKLGLGPSGIGEFHVMIEVNGLAQLDQAFATVSTRDDPVEGLHAAVNQRVQGLSVALYRDFPDPHRRRGKERF